MDFELLLRQAQAALDAGESQEDVNAQIARVTGFRFESMDAVGKLLTRRAAQQRTVARGGGAIGDFFAMVGQKASLGLLSKGVGAVSPEAGEALEQRLEDIETLDPSAAKAIGFGSAFLGPAILGPRLAAAAAARGAGPGLAGAVGGAATAGLTGGILGAVEEEGDIGERVQAGVRTGLLSGLIGAPLGAMGGRLLGAGRRAVGSRPGRVIRELKKGTGVEQGIRQIREANRSLLTEVKDKLFQPLDRDFGAIEDPGILGFIARIAKSKDTRSVIRATSPELAAGDRLPGHSDLQGILTRLRRKKLFDEVDELTALMDDFSPRFREANQAFREARQVEEAFERGRRMFDAPAGDISFALNNAPRGLQESRIMFGNNALAQDAFRKGMVVKTINRIGQREETATGTLRKLLDPGSEVSQTVRQLFPGAGDFATSAEAAAGDKAFREFSRIVASEADAGAIFKLFRSLGGSVGRLAPLAGAAAGGAALGSR